ncbi:MAG: 2-oxo acid dehydrogenase subunit E2 [Fimbriimonadaceae bacterium]|nr:2-oxo acid dehydrogenase subunit E2 [Fimbriimonadaceae bacterium]
MPIVELRIPQIGEGLQEARIVGFLKKPGDPVKRDEPIYQMETDKAVMDVESPFDGTMVSWVAEPDQVLKIGTVVGTLDSTAAAEAPPAVQATEPEPEEAGTVTLKVPQLGEGLQEARIVALLKQPGEAVRRDEPIYQMETDKAVMDVESPFDGVLLRWSVEADQIVAIGAEVAVMGGVQGVGAEPMAGAGTAVGVTEPPRKAAPPSVTGIGANRRTDVPPKTRAFAKEHGLSNEQIEEIPAAGVKLMPADVEAYLRGGRPSETSKRGEGYVEHPVGTKQRVLASRLVRGSQLVVPGMMSVSCDWGPIENVRARLKAEGGEFQPSTFTMFAYCLAKAAANHPIVRSTLVGDAMLRTYDHLQLGIAVSLPGDELVVAVVRDASKLSWREFAEQARERIRVAREGKDQADESVTLSVTNMQAFGIREAMAVVVPPGVATIFLGEAHWAFGSDPGDPSPRRSANVGITIDHRVINGVGGAEYLLAVRSLVENAAEVLQ